MMIDPCRFRFVSCSWSWYPQVLTVFMLPVSLVWPGVRNPTWLISGQSVCSGCGSDSMSCGRLSLLMNVTREPAEIVTVFGETMPPD